MSWTSWIDVADRLRTVVADREPDRRAATAPESRAAGPLDGVDRSRPCSSRADGCRRRAGCRATVVPARMRVVLARCRRRWPTSSSRTGRAVAVATISGRNASRVHKLAVDLTVRRASAPHSVPVGRLTLLWRSPCATWSMSRCTRGQLSGSTCDAHARTSASRRPAPAPRR